jgi:rhodanese-related sulfurtransferase
VIVAWACKSGTKSSVYKTVGVDEFERIISDTAGVVVLDARTQSEYDEGHIAHAVLIDVKTDSFMMAARDLLPKDKTIAVYCRSGRRSAMAADMLTDEGYTVVNLDGGIMAWIQSGKSVE